MKRLGKLWVIFFVGLAVSAGGCFPKNSTSEQEMPIIPVIEAAEPTGKTISEEEITVPNGSEVSGLDRESILSVEDTVTDDGEARQGIVYMEEMAALDGPKISDLGADVISLIYRFLNGFFEGGEYSVLENPHNVGPRRIYYAVHYIIVDKIELIDRAVGFEIIDGSVVTRFYFKDEKIFDGADNVIRDYSTNAIFGFKIRPVHASQPRDAYLFITPYSDGSRYNSNNYEGDSFRQFWNEDEKVFKSLSQDDPRWLPSY